MKIFSLFNKIKQNSRGDTIVEVLISMTILALVMGTAYVVSSHSLQTGTAAGQRNQALGYAQSQIEFIKEAQANNSSAALNNYVNGTSSGDFCFNTNGSLVAIPAIMPFPVPNDCLSYDGQAYTVRVNYNQPLKVFVVNVLWSGANLKGEQSNLKLYYKLPGGFPLPPSAIDVTLTASPPSVDSGGSSNLTWSTINTTPSTTCTFSANWPSPRPSPTAFSGSQSTGPLTTAHTFSLTCTDPVNGNDSASATVTINGGDGDDGGGGGSCSGATIVGGGGDWDPAYYFPNICDFTASRTGATSISFFYQVGNCARGTSFSYPGNSAGGENGPLTPRTQSDTYASYTLDVNNASSDGGTVYLTCNGTGTSWIQASNTVAGDNEPPPTCQDPDASNYGGPLPCVYPPPGINTCASGCYIGNDWHQEGDCSQGQLSLLFRKYEHWDYDSRNGIDDVDEERWTSDTKTGVCYN